MHNLDINNENMANIVPNQQQNNIIKSASILAQQILRNAKKIIFTEKNDNLFHQILCKNIQSLNPNVIIDFS